MPYPGLAEPEEVAQDAALPEDARERKRVLNILAQRRYRKFPLPQT